jgi:hypothetical protein
LTAPYSVHVTTPYRLRTSTAAALLLVIVTAAACSDDPKAPTIAAPEGYQVAANDKEGFALAVPSDWTVIPLSLNPADFDPEANRLRRDNPKLASILNQARSLGQSGGLFMAVDKDGVANVNITADDPDEENLAEVVAASKTGLTDFGATNIAEEPATLSDRPAVKLTFRIPVQTDGGDVPTDETQYYMLKGKKAYILTIAGAPPGVASTIAGSLKLR